MRISSAGCGPARGGETRWPSAADWLEALGDYVRYLHLSDNDGRWDQHGPLGTGTIPWQKVFAALAPRTLPAVIEVSSLQGVLETERYLASCASGRHPADWPG